MIDAGGVGLLGVNLAATCAMVGLIWFVQVVHYPLFGLVGERGFGDYSRANQRRTAWVVGPLMIVEVAAAAALVTDPPSTLGRALPSVGLIILVAIHACTAIVQIPGHRAMLDGHDEGRIHELVAGNWIRTAGWSLRGALSLAMLLVAIPS